MANPGHPAHLLSDVQERNAWRAACELAEVDLRGLALKGTQRPGGA